MSPANEFAGQSDGEKRIELERILDRFETAWRQGEQPDIVDYLPADCPERTALLIELVQIDLERRLKAGQAVRVEAYLQRYPELTRDVAVVLQLLAAEFALRRLGEPELSLAEYRQHFPQYAAELQEKLPSHATVSPPLANRGEEVSAQLPLAEAGPPAPGPAVPAISANRPAAPGRARKLLRAALLNPTRRGIWLGLLCAVVAWLLAQTAPLRGLQEWLYDAYYFMWRGPRPTQAHIVIVGLDEHSRTSPYVSPELAEVVGYLHQQGAAAIGIDLPEISTDSGRGDATPLGKAIRDARTVVLAELRTERGTKRPLRQWQVNALDPETAVATEFGFVNVTEDDDKFVRRQQLLIPGRDQGTMVPHFALALFSLAHGVDFTWDGDRHELRVGEAKIPLDAEQKLRINFAGPPGTFPVVPFREVLAAAREKWPLPNMRGAIVIIGVTAASPQDYRATDYARISSPGPGFMPGPELQANILATLADRASEHTLPRPAAFTLLLAVGALLGAGFTRLDALWRALLTAALPILWVGLALLLFAHGNLRVNLVALLPLGVLIFALTVVIGYWLKETPAAYSPAASPAVTRPDSPVPAEPTTIHDSNAASSPLAIPGYEILQELGRGGMGVVYKARQIALKRTVALKMILAGPHAGPDLLARFRLEAEAVARMHHPNIVQVHDLGEHAGQPFFALEYVDGDSLARRLHGQPLPVRQAVELIVTLARAVQHAHQRGIIHRDLKPANVLLTSHGVPKITDFGLAKSLDESSGLTISGAVLGTPRYMAPEQASGRTRAVGPATDVYALGVILYELLTGWPPFRGETVMETLDQVRFQTPIPPSQLQPGLPPNLDAVCLKCLEKEPVQRYPTAEDLVHSLLEIGP
jgi:CHASE2 domain-containing sensor protein